MDYRRGNIHIISQPTTEIRPHRSRPHMTGMTAARLPTPWTDCRWARRGGLACEKNVKKAGLPDRPVYTLPPSIHRLPRLLGVVSAVSIIVSMAATEERGEHSGTAGVSKLRERGPSAIR